MTDAATLPASHLRERYEAPIRAFREIAGDIRMLKIKVENLGDIYEDERADLLDRLEDAAASAEHLRDRRGDKFDAWVRDGCSVADERYDTLRKLAREGAL